MKRGEGFDLWCGNLVMMETHNYYSPLSLQLKQKSCPTKLGAKTGWYGVVCPEGQGFCKTHKNPSKNEKGFVKGYGFLQKARAGFSGL